MTPEEANHVITNLQKSVSDLTRELKTQERIHKTLSTSYGKAYRALISTQIAQLEAVKMLNRMMAANHTHREKGRFMEQADTIINIQIQLMKDEAKSGTWRFGQDFDGNELPF